MALSPGRRPAVGRGRAVGRLDDKRTAEGDESYAMVTLNADHHSLLKWMHRPGTTRPQYMQDERAVVPFASSAFELSLRGTVEGAAAALQLPDVEVYSAGPDRPSLLAGNDMKGAIPAVTRCCSRELHTGVRPPKAVICCCTLQHHEE